MESKNLPKRDISTPQGWPIQPPLWKGHTKRSFEAEGFSFTLDGESIKAEKRNTSITGQEFLEIGARIIERFIDSYTLVKGKNFEVIGLKDTFQIKRSNNPLLKIKEKGEGELHAYGSDSGKSVWEGNIRGGVKFVCEGSYGNEVEVDQKDFELCRRIFDKCEGENNKTLRGAISYFASALRGFDQLAIAGNFYKAMEKLICKFGGEKKAADGLNVSINKKFKDVKMWLDRGRHVPRKGTAPLTREKLQECKQAVREYILAYVEWLKVNEK